jgi:cation:H+ antiporter
MYQDKREIMILSITLLAASLLIILLSCYIFVNAVECLGKACNLHQGIVGSILAAIGTALPETLIPIIAIFFSGGAQAQEVGIGAIAGAPFMLGTLGFFVTGFAVIVYSALGKRNKTMNVDCNVISKDLTFFLIIYGTAIATSFFYEITWLKTIIAIFLLLSYTIYLKLVVSSEAAMLENVEILYIKKFVKLPDSIPFIVIQLAVSLVIIITGADLFIKYVQQLSSVIGVSPLILSLIITPIATELPEKLNSIIWVGRKKETLAVGNITGAMVFQSCFPVVFGMIFTPWNLHGMTLVSAGLALSGAAINLIWIKIFKSLNPYILMTGGLLYGIFIISLFYI